MIPFKNYQRYRLQTKNMWKLYLSSNHFFYKISKSIFRNLENDVISGTGSDFFVLTTVPRSAFLDPVDKIDQFWKLDMEKDILYLVTPVLEFWISTGSTKFGQSKLGTFFLLNSSNLNGHILKSYQSITSKFSNCHHWECLNIKKLKK